MDRLSLLSYDLSGYALYAGRGATARSQLAICIQGTSGKFEGGTKRLGFELVKNVRWQMHADACFWQLRELVVTVSDCFGWWMDMNGTCNKIPAHTWSILMSHGIWKTFPSTELGHNGSMMRLEVVRAAVKQEGQALRHLALPQVPKGSIKSKPFKLLKQKNTKNLIYLTFEHIPS